MVKVAQPLFPEGRSNPWVPSGPSPPTTLRPISQKQTGGEGGADRAKCAWGCVSDSDNNKDAVTDPLPCITWTPTAGDGGQGILDITTNQPDQMPRSQSLIQVLLTPRPAATTLFPELPPPKGKGIHLLKKFFRPPEHSSAFWCQQKEVPAGPHPNPSFTGSVSLSASSSPQTQNLKEIIFQGLFTPP